MYKIYKLSHRSDLKNSIEIVKQFARLKKWIYINIQNICEFRVGFSIYLSNFDDILSEFRKTSQSEKMMNLSTSGQFCDFQNIFWKNAKHF